MSIMKQTIIRLNFGLETKKIRVHITRMTERTFCNLFISMKKNKKSGIMKC